MGMKDIKKISQLLSAQQGHRPCPLHRTDDLYQAKDAREQAEIIAGRADGKTAKARANKRKLEASQSQGRASAAADSQLSPTHGSSSSSSSSAKRGKH